MFSNDDENLPWPLWIRGKIPIFETKERPIRFFERNSEDTRKIYEGEWA